jgi:hypothetical protein
MNSFPLGALAADADDESNPTMPEAMADLMSSGYSGMTLVRMLHAYFPTAGRADTYFAVGTAIALLHADLTVAEIELKRLRERRERA